MSNIVISPESGILEFNNNSPSGAAIRSATAPIRLDATGGNSFITGANFGIGTNSPTTELAVAGVVSGSSTGIFTKLNLTEDNIIDSHGEILDFQANDLIANGKHIRADFGIWARSAGGRNMGIDGNTNFMQLYTNGTEKVRITQVGDVGVGTTDPLTELDVRGDISGSGNFLGTGVGNRITNDGTPYLLSGDVAGEADTLQTVTDRGATTTNNITISNGAGQIKLQDSDGTNQFGRIRHSSASLYFYSRNDTSNGNFLFYGSDGSDNTERMRIEAGGDVGIGTNNPQTKLTVGSDGDEDGLEVRESGDLIFKVRPSSSHGYLSLYDSSTNEDIRLNSNGNSWIAGGSLGVGMNAPSARLELKGGTSDSSANAFIAKNSSSASLFSIRNDGRVDIPLGPVNIGDNLYLDNNEIWAQNSNNLNVKADGLVRIQPQSYGTAATFATNGNVGIGAEATTPLAKLDVRGDISGSGSFLGTGVGNRITNNGTPYLLSGDVAAEADTLQTVTNRGATTTNAVQLNGGVVINEGGSDLDFRVEGDTATHALFVNGADNHVGLGTATPISDLTVYSSDSNSATVSIHNIINNETGSLLRLVEGNNHQGGFLQFDGSANKFNIGVHSTNDTTFANDKKAITIDRDTANVGIGITAPAAHLDLYNTGITSSTADVQIVGSGNTYGLIVERLTNDSRIVSKSTAGAYFLTDSAAGQYQGLELDTHWFAGLYNYGAGYDFRIVHGAKNAGDSEAALTIQKTSKDVGIGTTNPSNRLEIQKSSPNPPLQIRPSDGSSSDLAPLILYRNCLNGSANYLLAKSIHTYFGTYNGGAPTDESEMVKISPNTSDAPSISIGDDGSAAATLNVGGNISLVNNGESYITGGNIGIGTNNPQSRLHIDNATGSTFGLRFTNPTETVNQYFADDSTDSDFFITYAGNGGAEITLQHNGKLSLNNSNGDNVGVGTDNPAELLHVDGNILIPQGKTLKGYYGGSIPVDIIGMSSTTDTHIYGGNNNSSDIFFDTCNGGTTGTRMTVTNAGNVGIGTTAASTVGGTAGLTLQNSSVAMAWGPSVGEIVYHRRLSAGKFQIVPYYGGNIGELQLAPYGENDTPVVIGATAAVGGVKLDVRGNISGSGSFLGTGDEGRITLNGTGYLLSGDAGTESETLQTVTTRGNTTSTSILSTGPHISGVTGLFADRVGIGTAAPSQTLHVKGLGMIEDASSTDFGTLQFGTDTLRYIRGNSAELQVGATIQQLHFQKTNGPAQVASSAADGTTAIQLLARNAHTSANILEVVNGNGQTADFVIDSDGSVGIGTTSPSEKLEVSGNILVTGAGSAGPEIKLAGTYTTWEIENQYAGGATNDMFRIRNAALGSDAIVIHRSNNNVGIGVTNPSTALDVVGTKGSAGVITVTDTTSVAAGVGGEIDFKGIYQGTTETVFGSIEAKKTNATAGDYGAGLALSTRVNGGGALTERLTILESGNVGIGTNNPVYDLTIGGNAVGSTGGLRINDPSNVAYGAHFSFADTPNQVHIGGITNNVYNDAIAIHRESTRTITIDSSEQVGIGTVSPSNKLEVHGDVAITSKLIHRADTDTFLEFTDNTITLDAGGEEHIKLEVGGVTINEGGQPNDFRIEGDTDTFLFFADGSADKVGIGTNTPDAKLHVEGSMQVEGATGWAGTDSQNGAIFMDTAGRGLLGAFSTSYARNLITANSNYIDLGSAGTSLINGFRFYAGSANTSATAGTIDFYTSGSNNRLHIAKDGNVGIGTTSPSYTLDLTTGGTMRINSGSANSTAIRVGGGNNDVTLMRVDSVGGTTDDSSYGFAVKYMGTRNGDANSLSIFADDQTSTQHEAVTIDQKGKVGIGTTSPSDKLHVEEDGGTVTIGSPTTSYGGIGFEDTALTAANSALYGVASQTVIGVKAGGAIEMKIANNSSLGLLKMEQDKLYYTDGDVGIGTNSPDGILNTSGDHVLFQGVNKGYVRVRTARANASDYEGVSSSIFTLNNYYATQEYGLFATNNNNFRIQRSGEAKYLELAQYDFKLSGIRFVCDLPNQAPTNLAINLRDESADEVGFYSPATNEIGFVTDRTERMRIDDVGNVGIGTDTPLANLHVKSNNAGSFTYDTTADELIVESNADGGITIATAAANTSKIIFASPDDANGAEITYNQTAKLMKVGATSANGELALQSANGVETMRLDENNRVGIGTISPATELTVIGNISGSGDFLGTGNGGRITKNHVPYLLEGDAQDPLTFGISNTNAVKIDSTTVTDNEYARFTANGLESRSTSEVLSDIGALTAGASSTDVFFQTVQTTVYAIGSLPSASPAGKRAFVQLNTSFSSSVIGSSTADFSAGSTAVPIYSDGSVWRLG